MQRLPFASLILLAAAAQAVPTPRTVAALPPRVSAGRGADVPFDEYEAENGTTDGMLVGPDRRFTTLAAEASGRRAVRLAKIGDYVEFRLARAANAVTVRVAIPDGDAGEGRDVTLGLFANGKPMGALALTSRYGWYYGAYPFTNRPGDGHAHHFFDETRLLFGRMLPAGTHVRLQVRPQDRSPWYVIDLADFELVPPPSRPPPRAVSIVDFGADPSGVKPSGAAFERAIASARADHRPVWIPPGSFRVDGHVIVDRVHIGGAGPWYSIVRGRGPGFYGKKAPDQSTDVRLENFAILGEVTERVDHDQVNGIGGAIGGGSLIRNLWIQHTKVGLWFDGPMHGIVIRNLRILDTMADGLNFHRGVSDAVVEDNFLRNTGDDGLAAWSHVEADHHIVFRHNTIIAPVLANGIALYGGHDIEVSGNLVADTLTEGGGLHLGNRFDAVPASGPILFADNLVVRSGSFDPRWHFGVGALWFFALDAPIAADVTVRDTVLLDSNEEAIQFLGKPIGKMTLDGLKIERAKGPAIQLQSDGAATLTRSVANGLGAPAVLRCNRDFKLSRDANGGLEGESEKGCPPS